jgi:hypothetical protein
MDKYLNPHAYNQVTCLSEPSQVYLCQKNKNYAKAFVLYWLLYNAYF